MFQVASGGMSCGFEVSDSAFELLDLCVKLLLAGSVVLLCGPSVAAQSGEEAAHVLPPEVHVSEPGHDDVGHDVGHGNLGGGFDVPTPMRPVGQHCIPVGGGRGETRVVSRTRQWIDVLPFVVRDGLVGSLVVGGVALVDAGNAFVLLPIGRPPAHSASGRRGKENCAA